jgi:4-diphosphocytidyl-2-C-methyl-D-erythritol kinase
LNTIFIDTTDIRVPPPFPHLSFVQFMNLRAYAKINIGLRILGKRPDGFHNIETVFHEIDLCDELTFERADAISLRTSSPHVPTDSRNLCVLAAEALHTRVHGGEGVRISLKKNIPVGAGLGGGSSDAATVLVALNKFWNAGLDRRELESLASTLGSDVPFFIRGGTAMGTSRGESLDFFDLKIPFWIVTVTPPVHISTSWAYSQVTVRNRKTGENLRSLVVKGMADPSKLPGIITNDFEESVFGAHPEIQRIKERMKTLRALFALMSGSGSSVFGLFRDEAAAQKAVGAFAAPLVTSLTQPNFRPEHIDQP